MLFFSGFSLKNEEYLFTPFIKNNLYTICGFSYGAIKAFRATIDAIDREERVDTLQLFSPAFFQSTDAKFKRLQLMSYKKNREAYLKQFLEACFAPYEKKITQESETTIDDLKELLDYEWSLNDLKKLEDAGVKIEVYLGSNDKIVDAKSTQKFFLEVATVTYIKDANHFLQLI